MAYQLEYCENLSYTLKHSQKLEIKTTVKLQFRADLLAFVSECSDVADSRHFLSEN